MNIHAWNYIRVAHARAAVGSAAALLLGGALLSGCSDVGDPSPTTTAATSPTGETACDRECLEGLVERYLQAKVSGDPSSLPVTGNVRYVENNQPMDLGDGTWQTIDGQGTYRHVISDMETGQAAYIGLMREHGEDVLMTLRLKVDGQRISEAEAVVIRDPRGAANYVSLGEPWPQWLEIVPEEDRLGRDDLIRITDMYWEAMENNDGLGDYSFFHDQCDRLEHGLKTTNNEPQTYGHSDDNVFVTLSCKEQFETGFLGFVTRIRDRRYPVVDVERQVVFSHAALDHNGTIRSIPLTDGRTFDIPPYFSPARTLIVGEMFRIEDQRIRLIEMTLTEPPYGARPAFDATDEAGPVSGPYPGSPAPENADGPCDRACLQDIGERLVRAIVDNDPQSAPLARGVRFTENDQFLDIGDGIWGTVSELNDYQLYVIDEQAGRVGYLGAVTEHDVSGILALRLEVDGRQLTEVEAVIVREEVPGHDTLFRPRLLVEPHPEHMGEPDAAFTALLDEGARVSRAELTRTADRYFDALLAGQSADVNFAPSCLRRENGVRTTDNPDYPAAGDNGDAVETMWAETSDTGLSVLDPAHPEFNPYALGCAEQIDTGFHGYVAEIRDRRPLVIDEQRGLVFSTGYFDIPGTTRELEVPDVGTVTLPRILGVPYTLASPHLFRVEDGAIARIEAINRGLPYRMRSPWTDSGVSR